MSPIESTAADAGHGSHGDQDLGPLAWVLEELRKSLDGAVKATRRFVREAAEARESDLAALDTSPLRTAKHQLHQSCGALDMVGMPQPAVLLRAMENAVQHYLQKPEDCTDAVAQTLENASVALLEYLEAVLAGKRVSAVALFPQYRDVQALVGAEGKVHPADLWPVERRLREPALSREVAPLAFGPEARKLLDASVLQIVKGQDLPAACARMREVCLGFVQAQETTSLRIFWKVGAGFFDAMAHGLLKVDVYTKRVASRVLMLYAAMAKGAPYTTERLLQDMLFFCAQAGDGKNQPEAQVLQAVYATFGLQRHPMVDYEQPRFGRFDPAQLAQARKRIAAATEIWSALAGGDRNKIKPAVDQFTLVTESLSKLHADSHGLSKALMRVMQSVAQQGEPPAPAIAMEVATSVLYLQAAFATLDLGDEEMSAHAQTLAQRLDAVLQGQEAQPLEPWMEQLYRQVSDQQTMGSVVGELRGTLAEAEKLLDQYFRQPTDTSMLGAVAGHLSQMRGVLSVLGLDQASQAMVRMRQNVERLHSGQVPAQEQPALFNTMGNSLGALGFLIDMLSYQRNMARKLYEFDEQSGELKLLMGRVRVRAGDQGQAQAAIEARVEVKPDILVPPSLIGTMAPVPAVPVTPGVASEAPIEILPKSLTEGDATAAVAAVDAPAPSVPVVEAPQPEPLPLELALDALAENSDSEPAAQQDAADVEVRDTVAVAPVVTEPVAAPVVPAPAMQMLPEDTDEELLGIFLEEAREVVVNGKAALQALSQQADDLSEQTILRRAFHTLKGSSRMVGLDEFGQAGWAMEQMLNAWLAEQKAMPMAMQQLALQALEGFDSWTSAIEAGQAAQWQSAPFRASADAMRLESKLIPLDMAAVRGEPVATSDVAEPVGAVDAAQLDAADALQLHSEATAAPAVESTDWAAQAPLAPEFDFSDLTAAPEAVAAAPAEVVTDPELVLAEASNASADAEVEAQAETESEISVEAFEAMLAQTEPSVQVLQTEDVTADEAVPETAAAELPALEAFETTELSEASDSPALQEEAEQALPAATDEAAVEAVIEAAEQPVPEEAVTTVAEGVKRIGDLSVPLPLFNVYLSEAESWSYRLQDALTAWQEHPQEAQPESAYAWAHSLAGSSATVGFTALSELARTLEYALVHVQPLGRGVPEQLQVFTQAAQEIRAMLHQFAAGQLRVPPQQLVEQLLAIQSSEVELPAVAAAGHVPTAPALAPMPLQALESAKEIGEAIDKAAAYGLQEEDDLDVFDVIDPDLFPIFEEEAIELLPALGASMREWANHPTRLEARNQLLRALHTLKGSARLAGAMRLGEMAHRLESALEALDVEHVVSDDIEPLFGRLDAIEASFNMLRAVGQQAETEPLRVEPAAVAVPEVAAQAPALVAAPVAQPAPAMFAGVEPRSQALPAVAPSKPAVVGGLRQGQQQTVRVRSQLLDRLINEAGEVMIARSRLDVRMGSIKHALGDLTSNLERLRQQLRDIEVQAESQMQSRMQLSKDAGMDFDPLEFDRFTRVQELTRMMAESVNDVATVQRNLLRDVTGAEDDLIAQGRQARELQRDLLRTRMVEFESISERLYAVVRQTSKETGKQVKLGLSGGSIEIDRGVLERMVPAFEHLLRNCVDHGIEAPEQRTAAGKPAAGTITVHVQQEGNDVAVTFQDDGAGLNVERIREKAVALGLVGADEVVDAARAAQIVFMPGFSTAQQLTEVSGRGIGMDVVRAEVQALGGRIETMTEAGQGSAFRLVLPLTTAVTQVVMLRAGQFTVGVPANLVEVVRRIPLGDLDAAYAKGELLEGQSAVPFYWAGAVWNQSARSQEQGLGKTRPVVVFRSASQRIALHVDEVLGHQEVVVKNLGSQMSRLPGLTGMSVLASGAVVLIYNPVALTTVYGEQIQALAQAGAHVTEASQPVPAAGDAVVASVAGIVPASQVPLVLVVDDSITVRRVSQRLLQREGYRVATAADGLQALERLREELPCVVLSDIEMPRMDGFDLLRNIRAQEAWSQLPVIMITSRIAQKHRDHAMELGANHYLGKPYSDEELMALVHHYAVGKALPAVEASATAS